MNNRRSLYWDRDRSHYNLQKKRMVSLAETSLKIYLLPAKNLMTEAKKMDLRDRLQVQGINPGLRTPGKDFKNMRRCTKPY